MNEEVTLYNSQLTRIYLTFINRFYPNVDVASALEYAGMTQYEVQDQGHWFTQRQVDRFQEIVVEKTGNPNIAREAGRFSASSGRMGPLKQYLLGLMSLLSLYLLMEKLYPIMSRGSVIKVKKLGPQRVEIVATPKPGVHEKAYQCENRIGNFEGIAQIFTKQIGKVEHLSCFHKGDECCRYVVTWDRVPSLIWKKVRNFSLLFTLLLPLLLFFHLSGTPWLILALSCVFFTMTCALYAEHLEKRELTGTIETQGDVAKDLLDEVNIRYGNALLFQEIGQVTSTLLNIDTLISNVMRIMEARLDFSRGMFLVANREKTRLCYVAGYGYSESQEKLLHSTAFHLDKPESKGAFVVAFKEGKPFLYNNPKEIEDSLSRRSFEFFKQMNARAFICVPIIYEKKPLGILAVDNVKPQRSLTQSDMSLLMGVAAQTAVSINNVLSFQRLKESEQKYRQLVENANSIILRMDTEGTIRFFNEFAQRFFGYSENEIVNKNIVGTIFPDNEATRRDFEELVRSLRKDPEQPVVQEKKTVLRLGDAAWVTWTCKPISCEGRRFTEILCIGNDITELKRAGDEKKKLGAQLQKAQKMEAVGTLAGGIAHDFNNILQAIFGYTQMILLGKEPSDPDYNSLKAIERSAHRASNLTKRLLIFSRKAESILNPVDLNQEVEQISRMLERTIAKMIQIEFYPAKDIKTINADSGQIEQIIMNLGINARDAMPDGGKLIFETKNVYLDAQYCKTHIGSRPGEYVLLSVTDTGHGMDKALQDRIFEPFFTTKETGKGTGLGLAMVYGIVKSHEGYITCDSKFEQGTTFRIFFPVAKGEHAPVEPEEIMPLPRGGRESILLVDDDKSLREIGKELLTRYGYNVFTAPDGESALDFLAKNNDQIDLIILDLMMPGMGGNRCLYELLKMDSSAKVIISSGYAVDGYTKEALNSGAKGFIAKPYNTAEMLKVIRETLERI